ncbi:MAG: hypothetical protein JWO80_3714 [Bryobacterales bacterium]|nr:hypothetical protein [Bryobacterales bacterium]
MGAADPREAAVRELHRLYRDGRLRVLVGNGISIGSGFPSWDDLNQTLLNGLVESDARRNNVWASLLSPELPSLSGELYSVLGRDGAADFVKMANRRSFRSSLAKALFRIPDVQSLPLTPAHFQLAAMSDGAAIATTNFDPLLELAIAKLRGLRLDVMPARSQCVPGVYSWIVEHLHGWIDPNGKTGGRLVLTEADYFDLGRNGNEPANRRLVSLFTAPGGALVVGMSMADINIRRLLYLLSKRPLTSKSAIYVVLKQRESLVDNYTREYWRARRIHLIFYLHHEELPGLLRDIQWGPSAPGMLPRWTDESIAWREKQCPASLFYDDEWQDLAYRALSALRDRIVEMFAVPAEEHCHVSLFVPLSFGKEIRLALVANSRKRKTGDEAAQFARLRNLSFAHGQEEGVAGIAFARGMERESLYGDAGMDFNFTKEMLSSWVSEKGYRDWRSVLAVPLMDSPLRLPIAVLTITSNLSRPFWTGLASQSDGYRQELMLWIGDTCRWVLGGFARKGPKHAEKV